MYRMFVMSEHTIYDQNKAHALINAHPLFQGSCTDLFHLDIDIFKVSDSILPCSPFLFDRTLRLTLSNQEVMLKMK